MEKWPHGTSRAYASRPYCCDKRETSSYVHGWTEILDFSVVEPLQLTIQAHLQNETANQLGLGLQGHLGVLRSRGFQPTTIYTDPQAGFHTLVGRFPNVNVDRGGAKDSVSKVDNKIRPIKELYRSVKAGLPWSLPPTFVPTLVTYAVSRLNLRWTSALPGHMCPLYLFTGAKLNFKKQLTFAFGDYCEVYDGTNNTSKSQSLPCIALHLCNNATGTWEFFNLKPTSTFVILIGSVWSQQNWSSTLSTC